MQISCYKTNNVYNYSSCTQFGSKIKPAAINSFLDSMAEHQTNFSGGINVNGLRTLLFQLKLKPISSDAEYYRTVERLMKEKSIGNTPIWYSSKDLKEYKDADNLEFGLIPYCGFDDKSKYINMHLSGRLNPKAKQIGSLKDTSLDDVVRVLDYSLRYLDKKYGKFNGIVYRQGFMSETPNQYISTTTDHLIAARLNGSYVNFMPGKQYSVIRTYSGHKIKDFQSDMGVLFADTEKEILLSRECRFRKLEEYELDDELIKSREKVASNLFHGSDLVMNGLLKSNKGYNREQLLDMVGVYEEII